MNVSAYRTATLVALLLVFTTRLCGADPHSVTLKLAEDHPRDVTTMVAASWNSRITAENTSFVAAWGTQQVSAQVEAGTGRVWVAVGPGLDERAGVTLELRSVEPSPPTMSVLPQPTGFEFREGNQPVLVYQRDPQQQANVQRAHYVHPLYGLDREVLTEAFPSDHLHHQGVFWAWHQLIRGGQRLGDPWITENFLVRVNRVEVVAEGPLFAAIEIQADWTSPLVTDLKGNRLAIVREQSRIRVFREQGNTRYIDFEIQLRAALPDLFLGGAENSRGYSGFTLRVRPPEMMEIVDEEGKLEEDRVQGISRWADVSGLFGSGKPVSGVAILSHPDLPEFPPRWLLRNYGMQNVIYPGRHPIALSPDRPLVLQHRLVIHRGDAKSARINDHQSVYQATRGLP